MQKIDLGADYRQQNPWWESGDVSTSNRYLPKRRSDYEYKISRVRSSRFTMIAGAAGIGKTTILHQIAYDLIEEDDVPQQNVMYLPLGNPRFQIGSEVISDAIDVFATYYWRRDAEQGGGYILIDDAHASQTWAKQVRWGLEQFDDLTVAVTLPTLDRAETRDIGDLNVEIERELLLPPKFYDVVTESGRIQLEKEKARDVRDDLETAADTSETEQLIQSIEAVESAVNSTSTVKRSVLDYFRGDERDEDTDDVIHNLESTIYRDIPRYQQFEDRSDLYALCAIAAMNPGRTLGLKELSGVLECDRRTLQRYIDILEDFYILTPSYQYEFERRRSVRLYLRDPLLAGALMDLDLTEMLNPEAEQRFTSTVVFDHMKRLAFRYRRTNAPVHFWESGSEGVDFVIETGEGIPLPFDVQEWSLDQSFSDSMETFCEEHSCEFGVKIARDVEPSVEDGVAILPLWLFLIVI